MCFSRGSEGTISTYILLFSLLILVFFLTRLLLLSLNCLLCASFVFDYFVKSTKEAMPPLPYCGFILVFN